VLAVETKEIPWKKEVYEVTLNGKTDQKKKNEVVRLVSVDRGGRQEIE